MKRPIVLSCLLVLALAGDALATPSLSNVFDMDAAIADKNAHLSGNQVIEPALEGGETIATAIVIGGIPFNDTGFTCDNIDNYDEVCPYTGSTSPDVVYRYTPGANGYIDIDLCSSQYDTKVYVYASGQGNGQTISTAIITDRLPPNDTGFLLIACNDDAGCGITGYQSRLANVPVSAGTNYYIVVDGYFGDCGDYILAINSHVGCAATCPAQHQDEGEPPCGPNYVDSFNGGCSSTPIVFSPVNCTNICGKAGTYIFNGLNYRDTDWYRITVGAGAFSYSGLGDGFTLRLFTLTPVCPTTVIGTTSTPDCVPSTPLLFNGPGTFFLFAGTDVFDGVPCESSYYLTVSGPGIPACVTATENTTWGGIKGLYR